MAGTPGAATYVKTTSGSIITVVPKSLATLGGKIISSNIVSGRHKSTLILSYFESNFRLALIVQGFSVGYMLKKLLGPLLEKLLIQKKNS